MNKLAFFVIGKIATLFGLLKKEIINGQEFQRTTKAAISLENNCLPYVELLIWLFAMVCLDGKILVISPIIPTMEQVWWIMQFVHMAYARKWRKL